VGTGPTGPTDPAGAQGTAGAAANLNINPVVIGASAVSSGANSGAIGFNAKNNGVGSVVMGASANSSSTASYMVGPTGEAGPVNVGVSNTTVCIGNQANTSVNVYSPSAAFTATTLQSIAIGSGANTLRPIHELNDRIVQLEERT